MEPNEAAPDPNGTSPAGGSRLLGAVQQRLACRCRGESGASDQRDERDGRHQGNRVDGTVWGTLAGGRVHTRPYGEFTLVYNATERTIKT